MKKQTEIKQHLIEMNALLKDLARKPKSSIISTERLLQMRNDLLPTLISAIEQEIMELEKPDADLTGAFKLIGAFIKFAHGCQAIENRMIEEKKERN